MSGWSYSLATADISKVNKSSYSLNDFIAFKENCKNQKGSHYTTNHNIDRCRGSSTFARRKKSCEHPPCCLASARKKNYI